MEQDLLLLHTSLQGQQALLDAQVALFCFRIKRKQRRPRTWWVRPWLTQERRLMFGHYDRLMQELRMEDQQSFFNFLRMPPEMFDEILNRVGPRIQRRDTRLRKALEPGLKLAVTIRHLSSGDKYPTLQYDFRVARNTISMFVPEVCQAIVDEYKVEAISCPTTQREWRDIAEEFQRKWNVPHACGALHGKHIAIRCPSNTGSLFHNYMGFFSVVLLALVDADYKFLWIDIGGCGSMSDAQIYNNSELKECLEEETIGFPDPDPMPNDDKNVPYFILGDDAFGLRTYLMKPYSQRGLTDEQLITNYRISRGRRVVENAFGILAQRWQLLLTTMMQQPNVVRNIVECCVCLHNVMRLRYPTQQNAQLDMENDQHDLIPGLWRATANMYEVNMVIGPNRDTVAAKKQREYLRLYFNSQAGSVPWQNRMISA
ncbi:putative nuclease HARBI1 [Mytilus trossulus]|uniref:putative nuclease HARBI1 n=1 Tax=Mytilus trossulus TaxID=6551 RepID=UPI003006D527